MAKPARDSRRDPDRGLRTPLAHVRGKEERLGDPAVAARLADCFRILKKDEQLPLRGIHGLHPYPARFHPAWARRILATLPQSARLLDPFCGSGTTLAESMLSGRRAAGSDLNPVAVRIARLRCTRRDGAWLEQFARAAREVHGRAAPRRETPFGRLAQGERRFPPHVLTQLINVRAAIEDYADGDPESASASIHEAMLFALSPLLAKFAGKPNRPAPEVSRRAVRDQFLRRCEAMAAAWADFAEEVPAPAPDADVRLADARRLPFRDGQFDAVVSSPPYPGVYDYAAEQELRARWIGGAEELPEAARDEIGRRGGAPGDWKRGVTEALASIPRVCAPGAQVFLVVGDGVEGRARAVRSDAVIRSAVDRARIPLRFVASVSQERPFFHHSGREAFAERPRFEHLLLLVRA
jgi:hypothetical protein